MHPQILWVFRWQAIATVLVTLVALILGGLHAALSAAAGGGIGVLSGAAYVWRAIKQGRGAPREAYRAQLAGESYKFAVTLLLFGLVFIGYREVVALPLFVTYALTFVVYWAALLKQS